MLLGAGLALGGSFGLGSALTRRLEVPWGVRLCAGAAGLSLLVFFLVTMGVAHRPVLAAISVAAAALIALRVPRLSRPAVSWLFFAVYGVWYFLCAAGPEIQADPNVYHLEPAREALRHGGFAPEISFFDRLPHALELLFTIAFAFGGAPAAKLVHFAFLAATPALILAIARRLGLQEMEGYGAAALYFLAPVVAVSGTSAFNDAALVCATLAMIIVILDDGPVWLAGLLAGFCYAIKMTGGLAIPVGLIMLLASGRGGGAPVFLVGAAVPVLPWLVRNVVQTGNPFAPFFNGWFPNPWFHVATEQQLSAGLRSYGVPFAQRFTEVLWGSRLQGIIGPVFVLAPVALLALRRRTGVLLIALATIFSVPWWLNAGSRFLMLSLPFAALAMMAAVPRGGVYALVAAHAVSTWPAVVRTYSPHAWTLTRVTSLEGNWDYGIAKMVESNTQPADRIFDVHGVHAAHTDRRFTGSWQSAPAEVLLRALEFARAPGKEDLYELRASFPEQELAAIRVRQTQGSESMWSIVEVDLLRDEERIPNSRRWSVDADPNPWESPLAFDGNLASRWMTWEPARRDQYLVVHFEGAERLSAVVITSTFWDGAQPLVIELRKPDGDWRDMPSVRTISGPRNLRRAATGKMKRAGFTHIVARAGEDGSGVLAKALVDDASDWGLEIAGNFDTVYLLRIR